MTLVQLEYIVAVDSFRHFVKAAEYCNVTQPTLSMQIKKFEEELNVIIFDRNKQPIEPTPIGARIIEQAQIILQGKERLHSMITDSRENLSGTVRIGIIPTIATNLSPLLIPSLSKKYPDLNIQVEELMTHQVIDAMQKGKIDIGIIATPLNKEGFDETPIYYEPFVLYVSEDHKLYKNDKVSSRDLNIEEMWLLADGHCFRNHVINLCEVKNVLPKTMNFTYETGSLDVLMSFVDQHFGYTLLPYLSTVHMGKERMKKIREFKEPMPKREIGIVTTEGFIKQKLLDALKVEIRRAIPKAMSHLDNGLIIPWKN